MGTIIEDAKQRIKQVRQRDVELLALKDGKAVENAEVSFRMKEHQFLFGAVGYAHGKFGHAGKEERFTEAFTRLFNYTMVPVHWNWYEPKKGQFTEPYTSNLLHWAKENKLKTKLHALIWHELCPDWVTDETVEADMENRIRLLMERFGDDFDFFDLANETTVNDRFDNPVSRWVKRKGPLEMMKFGSKLVRQYRPDARLLYGDWNVHEEEYFDFLGQIRDANIDIDILGMQSHMHRDLWTDEETMRVMDRAAAFGWPIHFPECSVISGKPIGYLSYEPGAVNRFTETEEDAWWQAEFTKNFYTLVFSHPAVEALSWFDFTDHRWLGAPAGLIDDNLDPKPVYGALYDLIHREWHSDADVTTGTSGLCRSRLFTGSYEITVRSGERKRTLTKDIHRESFYAGGGDAIRLTVDLDA